MDGVDAFNAAWQRGRIVSAPDEYIDWVLIPAMLHVDVSSYPPGKKMIVREMFFRYLGSGIWRNG